MYQIRKGRITSHYQNIIIDNPQDKLFDIDAKLFQSCLYSIIRNTQSTIDKEIFQGFYEDIPIIAYAIFKDKKYINHIYICDDAKGGYHVLRQEHISQNLLKFIINEYEKIDMKDKFLI